MSKDDATWLNVCYAAAFVIAAYIGYHAIETFALEFGWNETYDQLYTTGRTIGSLIIGLGFVIYLRWDSERHEYFLNSIGELRKVSWPSWEDTKKMTVIVVIVVGIFGAILAVFDLFWARALKLLLA